MSLGGSADTALDNAVAGSIATDVSYPGSGSPNRLLYSGAF